jgi:membrane protein
MLQKIIVILFAIILILFNSVGREKINRKLLIFLSSIIVLNAILLIVRQVTGREMELFSFLAIENDSGQIPIVRLLLEIVISLAILIKSTGAAKFRKDITLFGAAFIATQALMDYPGVISQLMGYDLLREVLFVLLYLCLASLACREWKHSAEKE